LRDIILNHHHLSEERGGDLMPLAHFLETPLVLGPKPESSFLELFANV